MAKPINEQELAAMEIRITRGYALSLDEMLALVAEVRRQRAILSGNATCWAEPIVEDGIPSRHNFTVQVAYPSSTPPAVPEEP